VGRGLAVIRVRRDDRGAGLCGRPHCLRDPGVHGDKASKPDGDRVCRLGGLVVVERQLEAGDHEHAVRSPRPCRLALDVREVLVPGCLLDRPEGEALSAPGVVVTYHVIRDAEDVEAAASVQIDELGDGQDTVAPAGMRVKLAQQWPQASSHLRTMMA